MPDRFVVDCVKPSVVAIFLLPTPAVATFSMARSSSADKTILVVKMLTNTSDLSQNVAVLHDMCRESVLCVDVKCETNVTARDDFSSKGNPKIEKCPCLFWAPPSPYDASGLIVA